jgi:hypothetical protein
MKYIIKYDYLSGRVLKTYATIKSASIDNYVPYGTIYKELLRPSIIYPRRDYYFGHNPKPRYVVWCYDNESRDLLGTYINIKDASDKTGVDACQIQWQINKDLPFNERFMGCTGLWFKRGLIYT